MALQDALGKAKMLQTSMGSDIDVNDLAEGMVQDAGVYVFTRMNQYMYITILCMRMCVMYRGGTGRSPMAFR